MKVLFYDDSVLDAHSERIIVSGIDLKRFLKNPVLLFRHEQWQLPIGKVIKVWAEGSKLYGDVDFDEGDDFAKSIKGKIERGYLNAFSISARPFEKSEEGTFMLEGQRMPSITKSELWEVSVVTLPSHEDALVIRSATECVRTFINTNINTNFNIKGMNITDFLNRAGLGKTEDEALQLIADLKQKAKDAEQKEREVETLETRLAQIEKQQKEARVAALIERAVEQRKITAKEKDYYKKFAEHDFDACKQLIDGKEAYRSITAQIQTTTSNEGWAARKAERAAWSFDDWHEKATDDLAYARANDKDFYNSLINKIKG